MGGRLFRSNTFARRLLGWQDLWFWVGTLLLVSTLTIYVLRTVDCVLVPAKMALLVSESTHDASVVFVVVKCICVTLDGLRSNTLSTPESRR